MLAEIKLTKLPKLLMKRKFKCRGVLTFKLTWSYRWKSFRIFFDTFFTFECHFFVFSWKVLISFRISFLSIKSLITLTLHHLPLYQNLSHFICLHTKRTKHFYNDLSPYIMYTISSLKLQNKNDFITIEIRIWGI